MLINYNEDFESKKKHIHEQLSVIAQTESVWDHMELILRNFQQNSAIEEQYKHKKISDKKYQEFKKFEMDAEVFMNMMIQFYNEKIRMGD